MNIWRHGILGHLPKTHWGFPVATRKSKGNAGNEKQRGIALLMAIMIISTAILFASDLILTSQVGLELAVKNRDSVKAEYMAKSANKMALFLLSADYGLDLFLASPQSPMKKPMSDGPGDIWALLNGMPIGGSTLELLAAVQDNFNLDAVNDAGVLELMRLFDGEFILNVSDEQGKINVNHCAKGRCFEVLAMLQSLMSCPVEKEFLQERDIRSYEIGYRIKDYIDEDSRASPESGTSDEDDTYLKQKNPYRSKNAPFDSLEELKMVDGWTEDMHTVFSPYLTIFPLQKTGRTKPKINLNTASRELLGCLFPRAKSECGEDFAKSLAQAEKEKTSLANSSKDFASILSNTFCYAPERDTSGQNRSEWLDVRSDVFRIEATGEVGDQTVKIKSIVQRMMPDPKAKQLRSYQTMYWRLF